MSTLIDDIHISNSASPEIIWGLGGPEEDHQLHHCCWTGRVSEREEEERKTETEVQIEIIHVRRNHLIYSNKVESSVIVSHVVV